MHSAFTVGFSTVASLKVPNTIVCDVATKIFDTEISGLVRVPSLTLSLALYLLLCSFKRNLYGERK